MSNSEQINALCHYWITALKSPNFQSIVDPKNYFSEVSDVLYRQISKGETIDNELRKEIIKNTQKLNNSSLRDKSVTLKKKYEKPILRKNKSSIPEIEIVTFAEDVEEDKLSIDAMPFEIATFAENAEEKESEEDKENKEPSIDEIPLLFVWGFFDRKKPKNNRAIMCMGVVIENNSGNIRADVNLPPRINRELLNPSQSSSLILGEFEQSVSFIQNQPLPSNDGMGNWISYAENYLKTTCGVESLNGIYHPERNSWQITKRFYSTENISQAVKQIINVYDRIRWSNDNHLLFENICLGGYSSLSQEVLPVYECEMIANETEFFAHCGHMDSKFPLDATQRIGVAHFLGTYSGQVQTINGPPGTGKTSMLKGAIASLFVEPLLDPKVEKPDPPIIIASSATNQAVTNIISSFASFADESHTPTIASRWIILDTEQGQVVAAKSFGWFLPASSRQNDIDYYQFQHLNVDYSGFYNYDKAAKNLNGLKPKDLEAAFLRNFRQALPEKKARSVREAVKCLRQMVIKIRSIHKKTAKEIVKAIDEGCLNASLEKYLQGVAEYFSCNSQSAKQSLDELLEGLRNPASVEKKCAEDANAPELWELFERFCDLTYRVHSFHLAARYWEGRWILDSRSQIKNAPDKVSARLKHICKIAPVIVATAYTLPKLFAYKENSRNDGKPSYLFELADVLIIDEAGQAQPEIGAALFSLAKRALVVGDTKQLQPIWTFNDLDDHGFLFQTGLSKQAPELEKQGLCVSSGSIMKMAQSTTAFSEPDTEELGIMLRRHYRCYPEIIEFCNELVYGGQLIPFRQRKNEKLIFKNPLLHITNSYSPQKQNGSWCNRDEAKEIAQWLYQNREAIEKHYAKKHDLADIVAIVTPYSHQQNILERELKNLFGEDPGAGDLVTREINAMEQSQSSIEEESNTSKNCERKKPKKRRERSLIQRMTIGTVHKLQGAERPIVIFSAVVQRKDGEALFFDRDTSMLNVALSRAKDCFILFGHSETFFPRNKNTKQSNLPSLRLGRYLRREGRRLYPRSVVVVESPRKAAKLQQIVGREFVVYATGGHFQQLKPRGAGVEIEQNFTPSWQIKEKGRATLSEIREILADADELILATDDDREGEEISRQVFDWLYESMPLDSLQISRVRLRGMSIDAILQAFCQRSNLAESLAEAARTRAILDYLIGGLLQEILKEDANIWSGSGRVQAAILGLLAQRKKVLEKQSPQTNWKVIARVEIGSDGVGVSLDANLVMHSNQNLRRKLSQEKALQYAEQLRGLKLKAVGNFVTPFTLGHSPPMTTAEVICRSSDRLNLSPTETMKLLQILYEGSDGKLPNRSKPDLQKDNLREITSQPQAEAMKADNLTAEGHPPITPLHFGLTPELVERYLPTREAELYRIIYEGTLASVAEPPALKQIRVQFETEGSSEVFKLEAEAIEIVDPGWLQFDPQQRKNLVPDEEVAEILLEAVATDKPLIIIATEVKSTAIQMQPHTVTSLMNVMAKLKVARPSTYGSIFQKLQEKRHIVFKENGFIQITERGLKTYQAICQLKPIIADPSFTLELESALDAIASAEESSLAVLRHFWSLIDPQARYSPHQDLPSLTIGEIIKAKVSLTTKDSQILSSTHPLHFAAKIMTEAIASCESQLKLATSEGWEYLPDASKVLRLWFLGKLYGTETTPIALLDRLTYDRSFQWFVGFEPNSVVWSPQMYREAIRLLSDRGIIETIENSINWSMLAELPNAEIFIGLRHLE